MTDAQARTRGSPALPGRPGKIVAIHLSYASRADQRGRRPRTRRTSSSRRAPSRRPAARSSARRHRAARVRGRDRARHRHHRPARRRSTAAWDHVAWVTAANDLGLYDLRANDKGSNVRSKGGDGFTPVGPGPRSTPARSTRRAAAADLGQRRARARTTRPPGCSSPLPQLVADLSQHLTLEPGDVILTGTPAGLLGRRPRRRRRGRGRRAGRAGAPSSGRLVTTVTQGEHGFDRALGSLPAVDDVQRAEAWGSREAAGLRRNRPHRRELRGEAPAGAGRRRSVGPAAQARAEQRDDRRRAADAPRREARRHGQDPAVRAGPRGPVRPARRRLQRPEARVRHGRRGRGHRHRGARRDRVRHARRHPRAAGRTRAAPPASSPTAASATTTRSPRSASPSRSAGAHPAVLGRKHVPWDVDVAVACGGTTVEPGRHRRRGRGTASIVIPPALVEEVVDAALAQEEEDGWIAEQVAAGPPDRRPVPDERAVESEVRRMAREQVSEAAARSKSQRAYHWLKERIAREELTPGYRLVLASDRERARHERGAGAGGDPPARGRGPGDVRAERRGAGVDDRRLRVPAQHGDAGHPRGCGHRARGPAPDRRRRPAGARPERAASSSRSTTSTRASSPR